MPVPRSVGETLIRRSMLRWLRRGLRIDLPRGRSLGFYRASGCFIALLGRVAGPTPRRGASLFHYLNRTCYNGLCRLTAVAVQRPARRIRAGGYIVGFTGTRPCSRLWTFTTGDLEPGPLGCGRFRLRRSALRRGLHPVVEGAVHLGIPGGTAASSEHRGPCPGGPGVVAAIHRGVRLAGFLSWPGESAA